MHPRTDSHNTASHQPVAANSTVRDMLFVSHAAPDDNEFARWLALQLGKDGFPVWCDQRNF